MLVIFQLFPVGKADGVSSYQNSDCIYFIQIVEKSGANIKSISEFVIFLCVLMNKFLELDMTLYHGLRMPNEASFHWNPEFLGLGRQIEQINYRAFGVFSAELSATHFGTYSDAVSPFSMFSIIQPLFLQKNKPL